MKTKPLSKVEPRLGILLYRGGEEASTTCLVAWDLGFYLLVDRKPDGRYSSGNFELFTFLEPSGELHPWHWSTIQCEGFVVVETTDEE